MKRRLAFQLLLTMLALGCGGDDSFISAGDRADRQLPDGDPLDGGMIEDPMDGSASGDGGGSGGDGGGMDGSASGDGSILDSIDLPDGSVILDDGAIQLPDGEIIDEETAEMRYGTEVDVSSCEISELDSLQIPVAFGDEGGYSIAPSGSSGFGLAVSTRTTGNCNANVGVSALPSMGALPSPQPLLPDCSVTRDVALLGVPDGYHLAWVDNSTETAELHRVVLDRDMNAAGGFERTTLTNSEPELEVRPTLAMVSRRPLLTWIARNNPARKHAVMAQFLSGDDTDTFAIAGAEAGHDPQGIAVSRVSIENRGAVAWVGPQSNPGVWVQALDETGHPDGAPAKLTSRVGASSSVDIAPRVDGGGVVYSIVIDGRPQVRFHRLDHFGRPRGDERVLISPPQRAQDASVASVGGGYAVAYRALPPEGQGEGAEIRMIFVSKEGNVTRDDQGRVVSYRVGDSTISSGRTQVEVSLDGVLMIGWLDANPDGGGNLLKVARRSLTCSE